MTTKAPSFDLGFHSELQYVHAEDCGGLSSLEQMLQYSPTKSLTTRSRVLTTPDTDGTDSSVPQTTYYEDNLPSDMFTEIESPSYKHGHFIPYNDNENTLFRKKNPEDSFFLFPRDSVRQQNSDLNFSFDISQPISISGHDSTFMNSSTDQYDPTKRFFQDNLGIRTDFNERFDSQSEKGDKPRDHHKILTKKSLKANMHSEDLNVFDPNSDALHPDLDSNQFSSEMGAQDSNYDEDVKSDDEKKQKRKRKDATSAQRKKRKLNTQRRSSDDEGTVSDGKQSSCCIKGCTNKVNNRMRQCLRCKGEDDWKEDFVLKGWDKICNYHYFADLYEHKKRIKHSAK